MEPNVMIAVLIGGLVLLAIPSLMVALAMRKLNKDDQDDKAKEQRVHESFQELSRQISDERTKREALAAAVADLRVAQAEAMKKEDLEGVYQRIEKIEAGVKEDLKENRVQITGLMEKVIVALAAKA